MLTKVIKIEDLNQVFYFTNYSVYAIMQLMKWLIDYHSRKVEEEILLLPDELLARYLRMTDLMQKCGPDVGVPHTRYIEKDLFELRIKAKEGIARIFYCTIVSRKIVMLHSFIKKTQKTPQKEIQIARKRLREIQS